MKKARIYLDKINWNNYRKVIKLRVNKDQRYFVASNEASLIHAFIEMSCGTPVYAFAIMNGKTVVGFIQIMYSKDWSGYEREDWLNSDDFKKHNGKPVYYIWRFMIDKKFQGQGFGKEALRLAIEFIKTFPAGKSEGCWLSYEPENEGARNLYRKAGFEERLDLHKEDMEIPAVLKL